MLVPLNWLKDYVDINDVSIEELEDGLVMSGSKTEAITRLGVDIEGVVTGKIISISPHPNADKLIITKVDVGNEIVQIVTGATNVKVGDVVPVALHGAKLPGGVKIKRGKIRGEESNGMLCSAEELGFPENVVPKASKDGIFILEEDIQVGLDILDVLDLRDHVIEFEITPNRPDCLCIIGMARETAATFDLKVKYPNITISEEVDDIKDYASIEVLDKDLCPRYAARVVKDVKIGPSPLWMQMRLMKAGVRPINNIVDITNYVMLEYGEPLHAFDLKYLEGNKIIVRRAKDGEMIKTLDGTERKLNKDVLVIADEKKPVGIAGIMGGENSEVTEETKTILIEAACFDKTSIRSSSRYLGLRTEASSRFEKGIDPNLVMFALNRVCQLIEELGAGKIVKGTLDIYDSPREEKKIMVRPDRVNQLLGTNIETYDMISILERLEFKTSLKDSVLEVTVPTFRLDLQEEIDIVEEVARIYGFDKIEPTLPKDTSWGAKTNAQVIEDIAKNILISIGLNEIATYSFISPKAFDLINLPEESYLRRTMRLINPLGEEYSIMRTTLIPNMMEVLTRNYNRNVPGAMAFEIGRIFLPKELPVTELPLEKISLTIGMYGEGIDFFSLKGVICHLLDRLGIKDYTFEPEKNHPTFHPGRCANILYKNIFLGILGEIHPDVRENYDIDTRVYVAEIDFNVILQLARLDRTYTPLPKYPAINRDIAIIVKDGIAAKDVEDVIKKAGGLLLENIELFDVYKGKQIPENHKSMAYSLTFRSRERTLVDEEVNEIYNKIVDSLKESLNAQLR